MTTTGAEVSPEVQQSFNMASSTTPTATNTDCITMVTDHMTTAGDHMTATSEAQNNNSDVHHMTYEQSYNVMDHMAREDDKDESKTNGIQRHNVHTGLDNDSEGESTPGGGGDTVPYESTTTDTIPEVIEPVDFIETSPPKFSSSAHNGHFSTYVTGRGVGARSAAGLCSGHPPHRYENWSIVMQMRDLEEGGKRGKIPKRMKISRVARVDRQRTPYPLPRGASKTKPQHARPSPSSRKRRFSGRLVRAPPPLSNASEEGDMAQADEMGEGEGRDFGFVDGPEAVRKRSKKRTTGGVHMLLPAMGSGSPPSSPSNTPISRRRASSRKSRPKPRTRKPNKFSLASADISTQETTTPGPGSSDTSDESVSNEEQGLPRHGDDITVSDDDDDAYEDARSTTPNFPTNCAHNSTHFPKNAASSPHNQNSNGVGLSYRKPGGPNSSRVPPPPPGGRTTSLRPETGSISNVSSRESLDPLLSNSEENLRLDSSDADMTSLSHASSPPRVRGGSSQLWSNRRLESDLSTAPFSSETSDLDTSGNERITSKDAKLTLKGDKTEGKVSLPHTDLKNGKSKLSPPLPKKDTVLNHSSSGDDTSKQSKKETKPAVRPPVSRKPLTAKPITKPLPPPPTARKPPSSQTSVSSTTSNNSSGIPLRKESMKSSSELTSSTTTPKPHSPRQPRPNSSTGNSSIVKPPLRNKSAGNLLPSKPKPPVAAKPAVKPEVKPKRTSLPIAGTSGGNGVAHHRYGKQLSSNSLANSSSSSSQSRIPRVDKRAGSVDVAIEGNIAGRIPSVRSSEELKSKAVTKSTPSPGIRKTHSDTDLGELRRKATLSPPARLSKLKEEKEPHDGGSPSTKPKEQRSTPLATNIPFRPSVPTRPRKQASEKKLQSATKHTAPVATAETPANISERLLRDVMPLSTTSQSDSSNKTPSSSEANTSGQSQSPSISPYPSPATKKKAALLLPQRPAAPPSRRKSQSSSTTISTKAETVQKQPDPSLLQKTGRDTEQKSGSLERKPAPMELGTTGDLSTVSLTQSKDQPRSSGYTKLETIKPPKLPPKERLPSVKNSKTSPEASNKAKDEDAHLNLNDQDEVQSGASTDDQAPPLPPRTNSMANTSNRKSTHFELNIPVTSDGSSQGSPLSPQEKEPLVPRRKKLSSPRRPPPSPPRERRKGLDDNDNRQSGLFSLSIAPSQISTINENYEVCDLESELSEPNTSSEMSLSPLAQMFASDNRNSDLKVVGQNVDLLQKEELDFGRSRTPENLISECSRNEDTIVDSKKGSDSELEVLSSRRSSRRKLKPSNSKRRAPPKPPKASNEVYVMVDLDIMSPESSLASVAVRRRSPDPIKGSHDLMKGSRDPRRSDTSLSSMSSARDDTPPPIPSQPIPSKRERLTRMQSTPSPVPNRDSTGGDAKPAAEHTHKTVDYTKSLCIPPPMPVTRAVKREPIYEVLDTFKPKKEEPTSSQQQQQQQQHEKSGYDHITLPLERDRDQILPNKEDSPPKTSSSPKVSAVTSTKLAMEDIRENWKKTSPIMLRRKQAKSFSAKSQSLMYRRSTSDRVNHNKISTFDPNTARLMLQRTPSLDRLDDRMDRSTRKSMHTHESSSESEEEDSPVVMSPPAQGLPRPPVHSLYSSPRPHNSRRPMGKSVSAFVVAPDEEPLYQYINTAEFLNMRGAEVKSAGPNKSQLEIARQLSCRRLWCEQAEIIQSGILESLSDEERKLQEAIFEVITTEETYLRSLDVLIQHFMEDPGMNPSLPEGRRVLDKRQHHVIFSNLQEVRDVSAKFLEELQGRQRESAVVKNIADIVLKYAENYFDPYIHYCTNQIYQTRELQDCIENNVMFREYLKRLESHKKCQNLNMLSFLLLPMQRITRLPLLILAIINRTPLLHPDHQLVESTLRSVQKLVIECNDGARKMERTEQLHAVHQRLDFGKLKPFPLVSVSRQLERKGTLFKLKVDQKLFGRHRVRRKPVYVFVFTDYIIITKRKKDPKCDYAYRVVDHASRALVEVSSLSAPPDVTFQKQFFGENESPFSKAMWAVSAVNAKHAFLVTLLDNAQHRSVSYTFTAQNETDKTRWMESIVRPDIQKEEEKIYQHWDCPQVQAIYDYESMQPDELELQRGDVVKVFRKMADGWYEGERLRDLQWGWFPSNFTVEVENEHTRARNLRETHKLRLSSNQLTQSVM